MPWNQVELTMQRKDLMEKLLLPRANISAICKEYGVSRKTAYKWMLRYRRSGFDGLQDKSKTPKHSPSKADESLEKAVVELHKTHPFWGPRKLRGLLMREQTILNIPSVSTFSRILKRHGCVVVKNQKSSSARQRFERSEANDLWQMDFKGSFMTKLHRCYPLTILDDYSRYSIGLQACKNEQGETVKSQLIACFKRFGLPRQINVDNGNPWGSADLTSRTALSIWLIKCGVKLSHSAPYHPQTNGKVERFHRTLKLEVLHDKQYKNCFDMQRTFDRWQHIYNYVRPHDGLNGNTPSSRYTPSSRQLLEKTCVVEYGNEAIVRKVHGTNGLIRFRGKRYHVGKALGGEHVEIKETAKEDIYSIFFMDSFIKKFSLTDGL